MQYKSNTQIVWKQYIPETCSSTLVRSVRSKLYDAMHGALAHDWQDVVLVRRTQLRQEASFAPLLAQSSA